PFLATSSESETIIIVLSNLLSQFGPVLAIVAGLVLAGILASTMSTADSQLLAAASSVSHDLLEGFFGMKMSVQRSMFVARLTVVCIAIVGIVLAWDPNSSVFRIVSFAWAGFGAAFGPVMLCALFWKRTTKQGALAGMIAGAAMVFIWKYGIAKLGGVWAIYELLPAFLVGLVAIILVSLLTPAPSQEITEEFDAVGKM
ncbi:MAG: sodium:proline symporter, partial [Ruminiclostridium sp.]|nr:sodium:proline symporter [Ruminiclostridium sp.]